MIEITLNDKSSVLVKSGDSSIKLHISDLRRAVGMIEHQDKKDDFVTIYTDASLKGDEATISFRAKCLHGSIQNTKKISINDINEAEMYAIKFSIEEVIATYPNVTGFFINSDNLTSVQEFWEFREKKPTRVTPIYQEIKDIVGDRWTRAKHVKAHTGKKDIRSYMNRTVDKATKRGWNEK